MRVPPLCVLALALATAASAPATTVEELSFDEIVSTSSSIVHGKVVRARAAWDPERVAIWTHYEIQVEDALKGGARQVLTVSEPGGEIDGMHVQVAGAPRYELGEEVVVFAVGTPLGYLRTCGWGQGKFAVRVSSGAPSGRQVRSALSGVKLVDSAPAAAKSDSPAQLDGADLAAFLARVRATVAAQAGRSAR
jgi:hypothetical protein